ncbi:MAG: homogentisate 1,2-dioxygenase [Myxococcales bacterium]
MLQRIAHGELPPKHHLALKGPAGELRYEECLTRAGFEGAYTILYHQGRPQGLKPTSSTPLKHAPKLISSPENSLQRRHFVGGRVASGGTLSGSRVVLLCNDDVALGVAKPTRSDRAYSINADADELLFIARGRGMLRSVLGDLAFGPLDYVFVPKGLIHRFELEPNEPQEYLSIECRNGVGIPSHFRNEVGQLRMDAPYCHRDFRTPKFVGPQDEGLRDVVIKRRDAFHTFCATHSPLDVVGWDGSVYPWAFPILAFQPRVSSVHLPPTWHGTFAAGGALICSFVPRPLEFHPDAIPCPYPHSSVDIDEVLYYVSGDFASREGVGPGSLTLHPRGVPHGPQPGKYEHSVGGKQTEELAVMLDCRAPLQVTQDGVDVEDKSYEASFA